MSTRAGAVPEGRGALEDALAGPPRSSLLGRVVAVLGLSFFAVEVVLLGVFTVGAWRWLVERRADDLREHADRLHGVARAALDARASPDDTAEVDAALDQALRRPVGRPAGAAPPPAPPEPPGAVPIEAWVLTRGGEALRLRGGGLEPVTADLGPRARWPAWLGARVDALLTGQEVAPVVAADLPGGAPLPERLVRALPLPSPRGGVPDAVLVLESPLRDAQRELVTWGLGAFGVGAVALLATAVATMSFLRRALLVPLGRMIRADNAARAGDRARAVIDEGDIPDDEVGAIMRSRNALFVGMTASREALDRQNAELARQREELRAWGRELERLVEQKTAALLSARDTLHATEKLAAVGRLAANVAHEINNPLASIAGYAEAAREQLAAGERADVAEALATIEAQAFRCKEILKRLLGLARADAVEVEDVALGALARDTAALAEPAARRRGVPITVDLPPAGDAPPAGGAAPEPGPRVRSDRGALQQVVLNLLDNAVDAAAGSAAEAGAGPTAEAATGALALTGRLARDPTPGGREGAPGPWVRVRLEADADEARLVVSDSGRGVPEALRARIFDPFYTTKPVGRGTGLGLAISQSLVERLGGRISVADAPGGGAAFTVHLPVGGPPGRAGALGRAAPASPGAAPTTPPPAAPAPVAGRDASSLLEAHLAHTAGDADPDA